MTRFNRAEYANYVKFPLKDYEKIHGMIDAYGGRVKDAKLNWETDQVLIFYTMAYSQRAEFEAELKQQ